MKVGQFLSLEKKTHETLGETLVLTMAPNETGSAHNSNLESGVTELRISKKTALLLAKRLEQLAKK